MRPNLNFAGNAADVLIHYQAALGGELDIMRFAGSPAAELTPASWGDKISYGRLRTPFGDLDVMDAPPGRERSAATSRSPSMTPTTRGASSRSSRKMAAFSCRSSKRSSHASLE